MMDVFLLPATTADFLAASDWFEGLKAGLGREFELEFYAALERIKSNPELSRKVTSG